MLNGYFIIFLDMPHLSVEVLLPGLFLTFELLLRKTSWPRMAAAAGMISLSICGGMPESTFLAISFACLYVVFRLLQSPELRSKLYVTGWIPRTVVASRIYALRISIVSLYRIYDLRS